MNQLQFHHVTYEGLYVIGHMLGDTYTGPSGGCLFENGVLSEPVPGHLALGNGMPMIAAYFRYAEDHKLRWESGAWYYEPEAKPKPAEKPRLEAKPIDTPKPAKKRRGRPKGSKNKAKGKK
jgi:hypothetical protein